MPPAAYPNVPSKQAQIAMLEIKRAINESSYDERELEYRSLLTKRQEVLATREEIHEQIRSRSQSKPERDQLRIRSQSLKAEAERLTARILDCEAKGRALLDERDETGIKLEQVRKQLAS